MAPQSVQWLLELGPLWSAWRFKAFSGAKKVQEVQVRISIVFVHHVSVRGAFSSGRHGKTKKDSKSSFKDSKVNFQLTASGQFSIDSFAVQFSSDTG